MKWLEKLPLYVFLQIKFFGNSIKFNAVEIINPYEFDYNSCKCYYQAASEIIEYSFLKNIIS